MNFNPETVKPSGEDGHACAPPAEAINQDASVPAASDGVAILKPDDNDILLGRGGATNNHPGNIRFRMVVSHHADDYYTAETRTRGAEILHQCLSEVMDCQPSPRFLKRNGKHWMCSNKSPNEKVQQRLREVGYRNASKRAAAADTATAPSSNDNEKTDDDATTVDTPTPNDVLYGDGARSGHKGNLVFAAVLNHEEQFVKPFMMAESGVVENAYAHLTQVYELRFLQRSKGQQLWTVMKVDAIKRKIKAYLKTLAKQKRRIAYQKGNVIQPLAATTAPSEEATASETTEHQSTGTKRAASPSFSLKPPPLQLAGASDKKPPAKHRRLYDGAPSSANATHGRFGSNPFMVDDVAAGSEEDQPADVFGRTFFSVADGLENPFLVATPAVEAPPVAHQDFMMDPLVEESSASALPPANFHVAEGLEDQHPVTPPGTEATVGRQERPETATLNERILSFDDLEALFGP